MSDTNFSIQQLVEHEDAFEVGAVKEAVVRYDKALSKAKRGDKDLLLFTPEMKLLVEKVPSLAAAIESDLIGKGPEKGFKRQAYGDVKPKELAVLTLRHCFNHYLGDQTIQHVCIKLADDVRVHKDDQRFKRDFKAYRAVVLRSIKSDHPGHKHKVMTHSRHKMGIEDTTWDKRQKLLIGKTLIDLCIKYTELFFIGDFVKPVKRYDVKLKRKVAVIAKTLKATEWTEEWLEKNHKYCETLCPILKPMVVPPRRWTNPWEGGYVSRKFAKGYNSCRLIRGVDPEWLKQNAGHIDPMVYEAVNSIQTTKYHINKRVLDTVDELKMSGLAGLPDGKMPKLNLPPKPWIVGGQDKYSVWKSMYPEVVRAWKEKAHTIYQRYWNEKSKRTSLCEKIRLGRMFEKYPTIYFPINLDWRGRTFCMSTPVLTPQGDDAAKGCIEFAEGKPIVGKAINEFKIHGANTYGKDKLSVADRVAWVDKHEEIIMLIDKLPEGEAQQEFWTNADKPFQFLAFCFDYAAWKRDPKNHKSRLICHIDQTCSGLQHWSAVLRDGDGGAQVGMVDKPMPDDIYQAVADKVEERLADLMDDPMARAWKGKVTRTITKRNVMTKLYGATLPGMRDQVRVELDKLDKKGKYLPDAPEDNFKMAQYIAHRNNEAMAEVVRKASNGRGGAESFGRYVFRSDDIEALS
jgi:DNA-directed RNA polymerase